MIAVTGATGKLGTLVMEQLLAKVPAQQIIAAVRNLDKAAHWAKKGVQVRLADYRKPETLVQALAGAKKVLLISSNELGQRFAQHKAVVDAAAKAHVELLVYTSILHADSSKMSLAGEHLETEKYIQSQKVPYTFLRNGWYLENYTENLQSALQHGVIAGSAGAGRIAAAARADYAAAAVAVLTTSGHANKVYELAGDKPFTVAQLAEEVSRASGKKVVYKDLPPAAYQELLAGFGLPQAMTSMLADSDHWAAQGALDDTSGDLHRLIGHATTALETSVKSAVSR